MAGTKLDGSDRYSADAICGSVAGLLMVKAVGNEVDISGHSLEIVAIS